MAITIIRSGIAERVPDEARCCPVCEYGPHNYVLKDKWVHPQRNVWPHDVLPIQVPTFTCEHCGCIWQWEPDRERHEED